MSYEKRKRRQNWLPSEKNLLMELVEKHLSIIEIKKIDAVTLKQKFDEWEIISKEYNSQTTNELRSGNDLKRHWESMKKNARKEENDRRIKIQAGGRPDYPKREDPIHLKILSLIKKSAALFNNHIDRDSVAAESTEKYFFEVILPEDSALSSKDIETDVDILESGVDSNEAVIQDWSDYTPKLLKTPVSTPFKSNNKGQERNFKTSRISRSPSTSTSASSSSFEKLHENKNKANGYQKRGADKETLYLNEAHKIDLQIKREQLKQEKIRTRILLLDYYRLKKKLMDTK